MFSLHCKPLPKSLSIGQLLCFCCPFTGYFYPEPKTGGIVAENSSVNRNRPYTQTLLGGSKGGSMGFHENYFLARDTFKMHFEYDKQGKIIRKIEYVAGKNPRELYYAYTGG